MRIASASKWIFGAYALQREGLDGIRATQVNIDGNSVAKTSLLNFTSGYDGERTRLCKDRSVGECSTRGGRKYNAKSANRYSYDGAHMQLYAVHGFGLGHHVVDGGVVKSPLLADEIRRVIGNFPTLAYHSPNVAGGAMMAPEDYARFLQSMLNDRLAIGRHLGADSVCAWVDKRGESCHAVQTPITGDHFGVDWAQERWRYSYGHWVEADLQVGDGAFSSAGAFGFYPWIDATKALYGIVAREEPFFKRPALGSVACGRLLRQAWVTGKPQRGAVPEVP